MRQAHPAHGTLVAFALAALLGACGAPDSDPPEAPEADEEVEAEEAAPTYAILNPDEMAELMERDDYLVVNVHIPYEGEIPGTHLDIPYDEIEAYLDQLPEDPDVGLLLYCMSGGMSIMAAEELSERGFTNLHHLDGGMRAWAVEGRSLENADEWLEDWLEAN